MPQGHLNVLKGTYPGINQQEATKNVDAGEAGIVRGSLVMENGSGNWVRAAAANTGSANTPGAFVYLSLQDQDQPDVRFAGGLTALPVNTPCLVETDQYDAGATLAVGGYLAAGDTGVVTDHADDETAVGIVARSPYRRYSNDRVAVAGERTGRFIDVVSFWTMFVPNLSTA